MTSSNLHIASARITDEHRIILALGCNTNHKNAMSQALSLLGDVLTIRCRSRMLWTEPIGIVSDKFLNCLVSGITQLSFTELRSKLKDIEQLCGRLPQDKADGIIRMDIDILQFDEQRFKEDDWSRDYVTLLINEIKQ